MNRKNYLKVIIGIIFVIFVSACGYFIVKKLIVTKPDKISTQNQSFNGETNKQISETNDEWKVTNWHDPYNKILGFRFDSLNSWVVEEKDYLSSGSERRIAVMSCPSDYNECDRMSFEVQIVSRTYNPQLEVPAEWTRTEIDVAGISADKIVKPTENKILTEINFMKDNDWYKIDLYTSEANKSTAEIIFSHMLDSFAFVSALSPQAPKEYELLQNVDKWSVTYQGENNNLVCDDGRTGNPTNRRYGFSINSGGYGERPGDVDTPYEKVISILRNNGWQQCKTSSSEEDANTQGHNDVFIKTNKLIAASKQYSMGAGNSLQVYIPYDKLPSNQYLNSQLGIKFDYPTAYTLKDRDSVDNDYLIPVKMNFITQGERITTAEMPIDFYPPETNYLGAYFTLSINRNLNSDDCKKYLNNLGQIVEMTDTKEINGIDYYKGSITGVRTGYMAIDDFYHTYSNGVCYEFGLGVRTDNRVLKLIDEKDIFIELENIFSTVQIN